jgi:hypothetical protein
MFVKTKDESRCDEHTRTAAVLVSCPHRSSRNATDTGDQQATESNELVSQVRGFAGYCEVLTRDTGAVGPARSGTLRPIVLAAMPVARDTAAKRLRTGAGSIIDKHDELILRLRIAITKPTNRFTNAQTSSEAGPVCV